MAGGGFTLTRDSVAGRQAVIGRRSALRLSRQHTFVLVAVFKADATSDHLDRFLEEAARYARTVTGGLGRQAGTCAVAVAVVGPGASAADWALRPRSPGSGVTGHPVLVDFGARRVTIGGDLGHDPYLSRLVGEHVVHPVGFNVG